MIRLHSPAAQLSAPHDVAQPHEVTHPNAGIGWTQCPFTEVLPAQSFLFQGKKELQGRTRATEPRRRPARDELKTPEEL